MADKNLAVKLKLDASGNVKGVVSDATKELDRMGKSASNVSDSLSQIKNIAATAFAGWGVASVATDVIRATKEMQSLQASLVTVKGSASAASVAFKQIQEFAQTTPYQLTEVTDAFIKMEALGLKASEDSMRSYGDTASSMGKSLNQMIEAVADASTGEFERLKEFGIKASSEGDRVKFTFRGVTTEVGKNAKEIEDYLIKLGEVNFSGGMELQMQTIGGQLSNLEDSWMQALYAIGTETEPAISGAISLLSDLSGQVKTASQYIDDAAKVAGIGLTAALTARTIPAIWATVAAFNAGTAAAGGFAASTKAATAAALAFAKTPLGLAVTAMAGGVAYLALSEDELDTATQDLTKSFESLNLEMSEFDVNKKAQELALYRAEIEKIKKQQAQGISVDVLGNREAELQAKIDNLMQGNASGYDSLLDPLLDEAIQSFADMDEANEKFRAKQERLAEQYAKREFKRAERQLSDLDKAYDREQSLLELRKDGQAESAIDAIEAENDAIMRRSALLSDNYKQSVANTQLQKDLAQFAAWESADQALESVNFKLQTVGMTSLDVAKAEAMRVAAQQNWDSSDLDEYLAKLEQLSIEQAKQGFVGFEGSSISAEIDDFTASIDSISDAWTRVGDAQAQSLANMSATFADYHKQQVKSAKDLDKIDDLRFSNLVDYEQGIISLSEYTKNNAKLNEKQSKIDAQNNENTIQFYQALAGEMSGAFEEGSDAAKAFQVVQQGLALVNAVSSIASAGQGDPYTAPFRVAAAVAQMGAILSQIGMTVSGGGGSAATPAQYDAEKMQEMQGTGTLFGSDEKSESIANSLDLLEDYGAKQYNELRSIDAGVREMVVSLDNVIRSIVSADYGRFDASSMGIFEGSLGGGFGSDIPLIGGVLSSVFGGSTKTSLTDSGIDLSAANLADVMISQFIDGVTYSVTRIDKDGGWFGSDSTSYKTATQALDNAVEASFGQVFANVGDTVLDLSQELGMDVSSQLESYVFDLPKISLKDLSAEDQLAEINAVVSAETDKIVDTMLGAITNTYQKIGEGDFETAIRLVTEKAVTEAILGMTEIDFTGDTIALSQTLSDLAGGIDALSESAETYYDAFFSDEEKHQRNLSQLTELFAGLNLSLPDSADGLRDVVESLDLTTESGQTAYTAILDATDSLDAYYDTIETRTEELANQVKDAYAQFLNQSDSLTQGYLALIDNEQLIAYQREKELALIDESLRPFQERLWALQDEQAEIEKAAQAHDDYNASLSSTIDFLSGVSTTIDSFIASYASQADTGSQYANTLASARAGDRDALSSITQDAKAYLDSAYESATSYADYMRVQASVLSELSDLPSQLSPEQFIVDELKSAIESQTNTLSLDYGKSLSDNFESLEQVFGDAIDYDEFGRIFGGVSSDLASEFEKLDANGDGQITQLEAIAGKTGDTADNTSPLTEAAETQITALDALTTEMGALADPMGEMKDAMLGLRDVIYLQYQETAKTSIEAQAAELLASISSSEQDMESYLAAFEDKYYESFNYQLDGTVGSYEINIGKTTNPDVTLATSGEDAAASIGSYQYQYDYSFKDMASGTVDMWTSIFLDHFQKEFEQYSQAFESSDAYLSYLDDFDQLQGLRDQMTDLGFVPAFASGGVHSGGLRLVGENGPELEVTGPSRIVNSNDTSGLLSSFGSLPEILSEMKRLNQRIESLERNTQSLYTIERNTRDAIDYQQVNLNYQQQIATNTGVSA